jgi:hypothetical protein
MFETLGQLNRLIVIIVIIIIIIKLNYFLRILHKKPTSSSFSLVPFATGDLFRCVGSLLLMDDDDSFLFVLYYSLPPLLKEIQPTSYYLF